MDVLVDFSNPLVWVVWLGLAMCVYIICACIIVSAFKASKRWVRKRRKKHARKDNKETKEL